MRTTRKIAGAVTAAFAATALATACTPAEAEGGHGTTADAGGADGVTTLELMTFVELHGTFYREMAEQWNAENPDRQVEIDVRVLPLDQMHQRALMAVETGVEVPDIIDIEIRFFANFLRGAQVLYDLTPYAEPFRDDIVEARLKLYSQDDMLLGLPTHVGTTLAFYNTHLLDEAGIDWESIVTWDDFREAGIKYTEATGRAFGVAETSGPWQTHLAVAQHGGDYVDADGNPTLNSDEVVAAVQFLQDLQESGATSVIPGGQPGTEEAFGAINRGDFAAIVMPAWYMARFVNYMPDLDGKIAIAPAPVLEDGAVATIGGGGTGTAVPLDSPNRELAAEFISFAKLSEPGNIAIWDILGFDPVNTRVWDNPEVTQNPDNPFVAYFINNPFDVLKAVRDDIGYLASQTTPIFSVVDGLVRSDIGNNIHEEGMSARDALDRAQQDLLNQLR